MSFEVGVNWCTQQSKQELNTWQEAEAKFMNTFLLIVGADNVDQDGDLHRLDICGYKHWISKWEQYKALQRFGFKLNDRKINISQEFADYLTEKYNDLMLEAEAEKHIYLGGDYIMNFDCWVKGKENTPRCW